MKKIIRLTENDLTNLVKRVIKEHEQGDDIIVHYRDKVSVCQREEKDIWQGLFEFPLIETESSQTPDKILAQAKKKKWFGDAAIELMSISSLFKQQLSHQLIAGQFITIKVKKKPVTKQNWQWVDNEKLNQLAFPQFINQFLNERVKQSSLF